MCVYVCSCGNAHKFPYQHDAGVLYDVYVCVWQRDRGREGGGGGGGGGGVITQVCQCEYRNLQILWMLILITEDAGVTE